MSRPILAKPNFQGPRCNARQCGCQCLVGEELLYFYLKPPVHDLFVEEYRFDGKGFKKVEYIDKFFHPLGAVDSLAYIFDLIDIKQASDELVVTLKAQFSQVFASLKMGGVDIGSALQVAFMLRALLS
jgi:hypothetical protein